MSGRLFPGASVSGVRKWPVTRSWLPRRILARTRARPVGVWPSSGVMPPSAGSNPDSTLVFTQYVVLAKTTNHKIVLCHREGKLGCAWSASPCPYSPRRIRSGHIAAICHIPLSGILRNGERSKAAPDITYRPSCAAQAVVRCAVRAQYSRQGG